MRQYVNKSDQELKKAVSSLEQNVNSHAEKLQNPFKGAENFAGFSSNYQQGLINHWKNDLIRNQEQLNILNNILDNRK